MTTEISTMKSFEENLKERLTKDIGTLIPDEALKGLIEAQIHKCFFEPQRKILNAGSYNERVQTIPSVFEETLKSLLDEKVGKIMGDWIRDNNETVLKEIDSFMALNAEEVFKKALLGSINNIFGNLQSNIMFEIQNKLQNNQY